MIPGRLDATATEDGLKSPEAKTQVQVTEKKQLKCLSEKTKGHRSTRKQRSDRLKHKARSSTRKSRVTKDRGPPFKETMNASE